MMFGSNASNFITRDDKTHNPRPYNMDHICLSCAKDENVYHLENTVNLLCT